MTGVLVGGFGLWCAPCRIKACANKLLAGEGPGDGQPMPKKSGQDPAIYFSGCGATQSARRQRASLDAARYDDVAVLVPCYNEELSIAKVVRDFRAALPGATIYVFDNNSTDRTAELAWQSGAQVVPSPCQGKGHVVRHMFDAVDANLYLMVDGDDTYRADAAPELIALARAGGADMVVGTRLEQFQGGSFRRFHCLGNRLIGRLLRAVFRVRVTDVLSGYRVFSREFVRSVPVMSPRFEIETELTLHAVAKKFIILEHPVPYGERPQGSQSKLNTFRDGYHILKTIFLIFKDYKPFTFFGFIALVIAALSLLAGLPAIVDYATTSKVWHLPSAVLAASLAVISTLCLVIGLLLHTLRNYHNENMELFRRCISQMDKLRGDISPDTSAIDARNAAHSLSYMRIKLKDPAEPAEEEYSVGHE
jgi:glycosyltransferase involved in cell wall biosynthesis